MAPKFIHSGKFPTSPGPGPLPKSNISSHNSCLKTIFPSFTTFVTAAVLHLFCKCLLHSSPWIEWTAGAIKARHPFPHTTKTPTENGFSKSIFFFYFYTNAVNSFIQTAKTRALTRWTFVGKVTSLFFNTLSRLVITFLPRSEHLLISRLQWFWSPKKLKSATVSPSMYHEVMGPDAMILLFWMLSFKPTFSLSSFTFIKRLFSSSSLSAIRVVSSAYLRLLIFLLATLIPACASSSLAFHMMCSSTLACFKDSTE